MFVNRKRAFPFVFRDERSTIRASKARAPSLGIQWTARRFANAEHNSARSLPHHFRVSIVIASRDRVADPIVVGAAGVAVDSDVIPDERAALQAVRSGIVKHKCNGTPVYSTVLRPVPLSYIYAEALEQL